MFIVNIASLRGAGLDAAVILTLNDKLLCERDRNLLVAGAVDEMWAVFERFVGVMSQ